MCFFEIVRFEVFPEGWKLWILEVVRWVGSGGEGMGKGFIWDCWNFYYLCDFININDDLFIW